MTVETGNGWTMHLGDCLDVMATLAPVDHVITDPPYEAEAHTKARRALSGGGDARRTTGKVRSIDQPLEISFPAITEAQRTAAALAFGRLALRWSVVFCQAEAVAAWRASMTAASLDWVRAGAWVKPNGAPQFTGDRPGMGYESLAIGHPKGRKRWNGGGKHGVWTVPIEKAALGGGGSTRAEHPTQKPRDLMLALVADFTDPGETILDPFAGSGTTGVAALCLGRHFVGIEKDPTYFALACERLRAEEQGSTLKAQRAGQLALLGGVK